MTPSTSLEPRSNASSPATMEQSDAVDATMTNPDLITLVLAQCNMSQFLPMQAVSHVWQHAAQGLIREWTCLKCADLSDELAVLKHPCFVAELPAGDVAVSEASTASCTAQIRIFSRPALQHLYLRTAGTSAETRLSRPTGLACTPYAMYVADAERGTLHRFVHATNACERLSSPWRQHAHPTSSWSPYGLAIGRCLTSVRHAREGGAGAASTPTAERAEQTLLFVADSRHHRLVVLAIEARDASGALLAVAPCADASTVAAASYMLDCAGEHEDDSPHTTFDHPRGVAWHLEHGVALADRGNGRIVFFSVADSACSSVQPDCDDVAAAGRALRFRRQIGGTGAAPGRFFGPYGVAFASRSRLLVSEFEGRRLQVLTPEGTPLQVLALDSMQVLGSGIDRLWCPTGLAMSACSTSVYLTGFSLKTGNGRVLRFEMVIAPADQHEHSAERPETTDVEQERACCAT